MDNIYRKIAVRIAVVLTLAVLLGVSGAGAVPVEEWNKTFGGTTLDGANSVQQTSDGGYIVVGYTAYGRSCGDNCFDTWFTWLIKTDANGNLQWNKTFGGKYEDVAQSVQETSDGGYILAGHTWLYGENRYDYDVWLIKTNAAGNQQWNKTFGGSRNDWANSVQQTKDGSYMIAGYTESYGTGDADAWLIKIDASGSELWNKTFGGSGRDYANFGELTSDGGYILAGMTQSYGPGNRAWLIKTDFKGNEQWNRVFGNGSDEAFSVRQTSDGGYVFSRVTDVSDLGSDVDAGIIKVDTKGNKQWNKRFGGKGYDQANSVLQTKDGGYIIAGETNSYGAGSDDVWLIKTDANGNEKWNKTFGGTRSDQANSVQQTKDGGYIITGYTNSYGAGDTDAWLIKVSGESSGTAKAPTASPTQTLTAVPAETHKISPTEKAAGFEVVPAITILLAVYIAGRRRK